MPTRAAISSRWASSSTRCSRAAAPFDGRSQAALVARHPLRRPAGSLDNRARRSRPPSITSSAPASRRTPTIGGNPRTMCCSSCDGSSRIDAGRGARREPAARSRWRYAGWSRRSSALAAMVADRRCSCRPRPARPPASRAVRRRAARGSSASTGRTGRWFPRAANTWCSRRGCRAGGSCGCARSMARQPLPDTEGATFRSGRPTAVVWRSSRRQAEAGGRRRAGR